MDNQSSGPVSASQPLSEGDRTRLVSQLTSLREQLYQEFNRMLPHVLIGISHEDFRHLFRDADESQLQAFKELAQTEALQHHLTILCHDLQQQQDEENQKITRLFETINALRPEEMGHAEVLEIYHQIAHCAEALELQLILSSKALAIVWSTSRPDLIEAFSRVKERVEVLLTKGIGQQIPPSGIYLALEEKLFSIYGGENAIDQLRDEEPAIEVLAKLSVWSSKDYSDLGFTIPGGSEEMPAKEEQERLFKAAGLQLQALGLSTIADLKKAGIFSKKSLGEYIQSHQGK